MVGGAHHPPLDGVDVRLRMLVDPALVAAVLGRVDGHQPRQPPAAHERARRRRDEPVVRVHEVEAPPSSSPAASRSAFIRSTQAMNASRSSPRELGLADAVDGHAMAVLDGVQAPAAACEDVDLVAVAHQLLGQLAHVARQAALDDRRVLPGQRQDPHVRESLVDASVPRLVDLCTVWMQSSTRRLLNRELPQHPLALSGSRR